MAETTKKFRTRQDSRGAVLETAPAIEEEVASEARSPRVPVRSARQQAAQDIHDVADFVRKAKEGKTNPTPLPVVEVLEKFPSKADQTRIQVLAAAVAARELQGQESASHRQLSTLAEDNAARVDALRMQEQRAQALDREQGRETDNHVSPEEYGANDSRIFTAAAAVALGYVAARGLPPYEALSSHSEEHLGPVPPANLEQEKPGLESAQEQGGRDWQNGMRAVGSKLARAAGPVLGDDEVAASMSPVSSAELSEDILQGLRAAGESHPRSIEELLNVERHPDEESEVAFEQDYSAELEKDSELEL